MSNHRARPRSGEFSAQKLKELEDATHADSHDQRSSSARSPARSYSAPYSQRSPPALVIDSGDGSSGGSGSSSRGIRVRPADHEAPQQRHRRVVSLSWPGEARLIERNTDWYQQLQDMSRRISISSNSSNGSISGSSSSNSKAAAVADADAMDGSVTTSAAQVNDNVKAAPNKRQRQMAFSHKRVSSGPIDIPPSPRTAAANAPATAARARGFRGALDWGDAFDVDSPGGRAATDASEWYPCWSATRPDDKKCGKSGGPPEHILMWERAVRSGSQAQAIGAGGGGGCSSPRVSHGSARGEVVGLDDSEGEAEEDEWSPTRQERRLSLDQDHGSGTAMLFEMDM